MQDDGHYAPGKPAENEQSERGYKEEEVFVVPFPDTVVHPWTMVVKLLQGREAINDNKEDQERQYCC